MLTDFYGNYAIDIRTGDQLCFSYVVMKTKTIRVPGSTSIDNEV